MNINDLKQKKLNLGCGYDHKDGWINLDIDKTCQPDILASALDLPFADNSIDEIICRHVVEHFSPDEAQQFFNEVYRVLKIGCRAHLRVDKDWSKKRLLSKDPTHKYRYQARELKNMAKQFSEKKVKDKIYFMNFKPLRKIFIELIK